MTQDKHNKTDIEHMFPVDEHEEVVSENGKAVRRRGVYLLPNLLTSGALFGGFYAIMSALNGQFIHASVAIFIAMILDGLDGRVARLTNTQSAFGAQYDSLADLVSFGVAPALVCYCWALEELGNIGWMAAFLYTACTALRLARFNSTADESADKRFFIGLPCPSAAALTASMIWVLSDFGIDGQFSWAIAVLATVILVICALLMVCNVRYCSFKQLDFKGRVPFIAILATILVLAFLAVAPSEVLLGIFIIYVVSGPLMAITGWGHSPRVAQNPEDAPDS